jgi:hypothetical protein
MSRPSLTFAVAVVLAAAAEAVLAPRPSPAAPPGLPNVVLCMADDGA